MGWQIHCIKNTVSVTKKIAEELFRAHCYEGSDEGDLWMSLDDVLDKKQICFNPDHSEHMDWLGTYSDLVDILKSHHVKGDIVFIDAESSEWPRIWGYRFDGKGDMRKLTGDIVISEASK